jgi:transposase
LQIDFGERRVVIGGVATKVFLLVATLGFSRRMHVRAFCKERQESWLEGLESTFRHFGGATAEILLDNDRGLVSRHDSRDARGRVQHHLPGLRPALGVPAARLRAVPARTKGKDERGVGYVKRNAVAGRTFESFAALEAHLEAWCARSRTCAFTARRARRRRRGSRVKRRRRCGRSQASHHSRPCAS